ncbi:MAG: DUF6055 domain-containing protein [Anaerolineae bacterium]|nr:DUF6055 domain-containing protein [Anaerolineae bacterium]
MRRLIVHITAAFMLLAFGIGTAAAQVKAVQEFQGSVSLDVEYAFFDLRGMNAGDTLYVYAESAEIDTMILIGNFEFTEEYVRNDDISTNNTNSAVSYTFPAFGDYSVAVTDCCRSDASGGFRVVLGLNAPEVLNDAAVISGRGFAEYINAAAPRSAPQLAGNAQIQELTGSVDADNPNAYFDLLNMRAGDTVYLYAGSDRIDTYMVVCDINCNQVFAEDDDSGGNYNAALTFTFPSDGDYSIAVHDCCNTSAAGDFVLRVGYDAPVILSGGGQSTGAQIAQYANPIAATPVPQLTGGEQIQELTGNVSADSPYAYFDMFGMHGGDTIYLYAGSDRIDTYMAVCDINCEEVFAEDDDSGGNYNSALTFTFPSDGDYSIAVYDCCSESASGSFTLRIGYDAPVVLSGGGRDTGAQIAVPYSPATASTTPENFTASDRQVQEFTGAVSPDQEFNFYDLYGMRAGQVLYIYAESSEFDTMIVMGDIDFNNELARGDDISTTNTNSTLQFTVPADGDYSIAITDCCRSDVSGGFRMVIGLNAPDVLDGTARDNGAQIARVYQGQEVTVGDYDRTPAATCDQQQAQGRPSLSGPEQTRESQNFIIHYTTSGQDSVTTDYVDAVETTMEEVLQIETQQMGWPLPPLDCGEGGDTRFDVYLKETLSEGIMGYAQPGNVIGDNPSSSKVEEWAAYSFLVLDNDFNGHPTPRPAMRVTAAHEFHHAIQFGYDLNDAVNWVYEATSTWMETQTFKNDEDATPYVVDLFEYPDLCIGSTPDNPDYHTRIYAEWLLIDNIARDYGVEAIKELWNEVADYEGMDAFYRFLGQLGTTPQDVVMRYAIRDLLLDYDLAGKFRLQVRIEGKINGFGVVTPRSSGVEELGVDYVQITMPGIYTFSIDHPNLRLAVVGINQADGTAQVFDLGQSGSVDTTAFSHSYVIILNTTQHNDPDNCTMTNWSLNVTNGKGAPLATPLPETFNASRFIPA